MNAEETGRVLAKAASYDRRKIGEAEVIAWLQALGDLPFRDCEAAVIAHYADSTEWLLPAHIRRRVREAQLQRMQDTEIPPPPRELLDNPPAYRAALRAAAVAIRDGGDPEVAMQTITRTVRRELENK